MFSDCVYVRVYLFCVCSCVFALFKVFKGPEQFRSSKGDDQSLSGVRKRESEDATVPAKKHKVSKKKSTIMTFLFIIVYL